MSISSRQFYIDGNWVASRARREPMVVNPATEEDFGIVALASESDVDGAEPFGGYKRSQALTRPR